MIFPRVKKLVFSLLPAFILLLFAEGSLRVILFYYPSWDVVVAGVAEVEEDRDLFWKLKKNLSTEFHSGQKLTTNRLGLRDKEIGPKSNKEFRILCLGESTTYGVFVEFDETYCQVTQRQLTDKYQGTRRFRVINAGVPAYTSFQSKIYLAKEGNRLKPDVVVLYHEGNDYLPCGWGDVSGKNETDPECYARRQRWSWSWSLGYLRVVRVPAYWVSRWSSGGLDEQVFSFAWSRFGNRAPGIKTRLCEKQQWEVLEDFRSLCDSLDSQLVIIHPTYRATRRHRCILTQFVRTHNIPFLESFDLFPHRAGYVIPDWFVDEAHPTVDGHRRIGEGLSELLLSQKWFPR